MKTEDHATLRTCTRCGNKMYDYRASCEGDCLCMICAESEARGEARDEVYTLFAKILGCPSGIYTRVEAHAEMLMQEHDELRVKLEAAELALSQPEMLLNRLTSLAGMARALAQASTAADVLSANISAQIDAAFKEPTP